MEEVSVFHPTDRPNFCAVRVGGIQLWFSYTTCIAFQGAGHSLTLIKNTWGPTTGKHLNMLDSDASKRLDKDEFEKRLNMVINRYLIQELALA